MLSRAILARFISNFGSRSVSDGELLAGGGFRTGQVIGATDRTGGTIAKRPVHFGEVHASLYRHFGIDPHAVTLPDFTGRPHFLVDDWKPLPELV